MYVPQNKSTDLKDCFDPIAVSAQGSALSVSKQFPTFHGDTSLDPCGKMKGLYVLMPGIVYKYSIYRQVPTSGKPPCYEVRGSVCMLSADGSIFKSKARPTLTYDSRGVAGDSDDAKGLGAKKAPRNNLHAQKKAINLHSLSGDDICKEIVSKARLLFEENAKYILSDVEKRQPVSQTCLALQFQLNLKRYLGMLVERGIAKTNDAQHVRELRIKKSAPATSGTFPSGISR